MALRPAKCYHWDSPAYTRRAKNPQDSFVTGIPGSKIQYFDMGNKSGRFDTEISILSKNRIQVRHNALEAARISVNKSLEERMGTANYLFKVRVFPHHIMRENVMATGAGADRVQSGMRGAFGKPMGTAARVSKGQAVMSVYIKKTEERIRNVREALKLAKSKLPGQVKISIKPVKTKG
jgi:large subunit ribosomal protein L10e